MRFLLRLSRLAVARASRTASPASPARNVAKTLAQTSVLWAIFLLLLPHWISSLERRRLPLASHLLPPRPSKYLGALLFVAGGSLGIWSGVTMALRGRGTPLPVDAVRELVASGPYAHVRNPMAMGSLLQGVAVGLWKRSPLVVLYGLCGVPFWNLMLRPGEEDALEARFGAAYLRYKSRVRCWIPRLGSYKPQ